MFGSFGERSACVKEYIGLAVDYREEHSGRTMAATTVEAVKTVLRRRYICKISAANNWRGLANLVPYRTKYVGTLHT